MKFPKKTKPKNNNTTVSYYIKRILITGKTLLYSISLQFILIISAAISVLLSINDGAY